MKKGLVLAGGGSRGAYQIGVWQALRELSYEVEAVAGTSVGALNAAMMVQGDFDRAVELWERLTTADVFATGDLAAQGPFSTAKAWMGALGGADASPLHQLVRATLNEERIRQSPMDFGLVTVGFPDFRPVSLVKEEMEPGKLIDYILASAACFPAMKSYPIGGKQYIDGGYYDNLPVEIALRQGARDIIAVDLQAIGLYRTKPHPGVRLRTLRSHWDLGPMLTFDPKVSRRNLRLGYLDALRLFGRLEGQAYAFEPGALGKMAESLFPYVGESCRRCSFGLLLSRGLLGEDGGKLRLIQALGLKRGDRYSFSAFLTRCAQVGGKALGLDPCEVYTARRFLKAAADAWREGIGHKAQEVAPDQPEILLSTARRLVKEGSVPLSAYLADCIWAVFEKEIFPHSLWLLAAKYPKAFAAGIFLLLARQLGEPRLLG